MGRFGGDRKAGEGVWSVGGERWETLGKMGGLGKAYDVKCDLGRSSDYEGVGWRG